MLNSASATFGLVEHGQEIADRQMLQAEAVDHRIGVGQRAQQQREHGVDHEETEDRQQKRDPDAGERAPAPALNAALGNLDAPV